MYFWMAWVNWRIRPRSALFLELGPRRGKRRNKTSQHSCTESGPLVVCIRYYRVWWKYGTVVVTDGTCCSLRQDQHSMHCIGLYIMQTAVPRERAAKLRHCIVPNHSLHALAFGNIVAHHCLPRAVFVIHLLARFLHWPFLFRSTITWKSSTSKRLKESFHFNSKDQLSVALLAKIDERWLV